MDELEAALSSAAQRSYDEASRRAALDLPRLAAERGLLDVAYARMEGPLGHILLAATERGLVCISYAVEGEGEVLSKLARELSPRLLESPRRLESVRRQLDEYFEGRRRLFDLALDWTLVRGFGRRVLDATVRIPYGSLATYTQVAGQAGNARASRAAGNALGANPIPIVIPCHRVVRTGGGLGGYTGGLDIKRRLLRLEGALLA
jgi:methylated-DNA-[protein]-cysteine S-methyltransferase